MERIIIPIAFLSTVLVFWMLPRAWRTAFLTLASTSMLLWLDPAPVAIMVCIAAGTFGYLRLAEGRPAWTTPIAFGLLIAGIASYLVVVKYLPGLDALARGSTAPAPIVPVGLSYLTFRLIHYAIETHAGRLPVHSFVEFMAYVTFVPIFSAGPIERFDRFLAHRVQVCSRNDLRDGLQRIILGMIKAFALPTLILWGTAFDSLEGVADSLLASAGGPAAALVWTALAVTTLSFYLNFAGYSDIAIGSARLLGFGIAENFNRPILSTSIVEFWRRWHITLGEWARTYVFFPASRLVQSATLGALLSFMVIGLWHAGTIHWLAYGLWHGCGVIVANAYTKRGWRLSHNAQLAAGLGWLLTMGFVTLGTAFPVLSGRGSLVDSITLIAAAFGVRL
ncbi:MAG: MBOAT family O-acyltransferase [Hyphomicrobiaceae bacterium]